MEILKALESGRKSKEELEATILDFDNKVKELIENKIVFSYKSTKIKDGKPETKLYYSITGTGLETLRKSNDAGRNQTVRKHEVS